MNMETFQEVPLAEIHRIVEPILTRLLSPLGFESVAHVRWVRSADAPIRQIFGLFKWKGGVVAPRWGMSLDFVPHITGGSPKWHRTPKSATFDLCVDARDRALDMSFIWGINAISQKAPTVMQEAVARASRFWATANTLSKLPTAFEALKLHLSRSDGLEFYNFSQHPVAYAFVLAMNGRVDEGKQEMEKFIGADRYVEKTEKHLRELFEQACRLGK